MGGPAPAHDSNSLMSATLSELEAINHHDVDIRITSDKRDFDTSEMLMSEDIHTNPLLARAVTPITPHKTEGQDGRRRMPSPSPLDLDMTRMGRTLASMRAEGNSSPTRFVQSLELSQVPPLSDDEEDYGSQGFHAYRASVDSDRQLSPGLLGKFPTTPLHTSPSNTVLPKPSTTAPKMPSPLSSNGFETELLAAEAEAVEPRWKNDDLEEVSSQVASGSHIEDIPVAPTPRIPRTSFSSMSSRTSTTSNSHMSSSARSDVADCSFRGRAPRQQERSGSPDIDSIICSTPRPRTRSKSQSASTRKKSTRQSNARTPSEPRLTNENDMAYGGMDFGGDEYGTQIARHKGGYDLSPEWDVDEFGALRTPGSAANFYDEQARTMLDRGPKPEQVEESDDSDLDLHTPLPHILLREGVLSPHSKVLASYRGSSALSDSACSGMRSSVLSTATDGEF
jgi:hypothetical protein